MAKHWRRDISEASAAARGQGYHVKEADVLLFYNCFPGGEFAADSMGGGARHGGDNCAVEFRHDLYVFSRRN